jgi:hypothetical protein
MKSKIIQSQQDLEFQLKEQLEFIASSAEAYDAGKFAESKRIATSVRVLVHDTGSSTSLLKLWE